MKLSIGHRLFLTMLLAFVMVGAAGLVLARWKLFQAPSGRDTTIDIKRLDRLASALSTVHRNNHRGWSFLPSGDAARYAWLTEQLAEVDHQIAGSAAAPLAPGLDSRIGLLDKNQRRLAGSIANPMIRAFASIDTLQRPVRVDGATVGYLVVASPHHPDEALAVAFLIDQQGNLFILAVFGLVLSACASILLALHFRRPILQLLEGSRRLGNAQFDTRLAIRRSDEFGELAATFNQLAARLEGAEQSRRLWVADTSHELRTPLSVLRGQLEAMQDGVRCVTPENIVILLRQLQSLTKLVDDLNELARADVGQLQYDKTPADAWQLVSNEMEAFAEKFGIARLLVTIGDAPARSIVHGDAVRIRQVVTNLLENCVRYTDADGRIELNGTNIANELRITIDDSAPAVPMALLDRLGERFFRVESSRSRQTGGAGLGLALCTHIIEAHEGRLEFGPSPLGGLRATIVLPLELIS